MNKTPENKYSRLNQHLGQVMQKNTINSTIGVSFNLEKSHFRFADTIKQRWIDSASKVLLTEAAESSDINRIKKIINIELTSTV